MARLGHTTNVSTALAKPPASSEFMAAVLELFVDNPGAGREAVQGKRPAVATFRALQGKPRSEYSAVDLWSMLPAAYDY